MELSKNVKSCNQSTLYTL